MTRPFFTKDRITHFENFDRHADQAIHQLKTRLNEGYAVDIQVLSLHSKISKPLIPSPGRSHAVHS